jgi:prepilin-type processing-associated H-X9-DG protein
LLVVIAIIAILAAILFPVFAQARDKARSATCLSNNKQMSLAFDMYSEDYDEMIPYNYYYVESNGVYRLHWTGMLYPYTKNWGIFTCPSDVDPTVAGGGTVKGVYMPDYQAPLVSYIANYAVLSVYNQVPGNGPISMAVIGQPSSVIWVAEKRDYLADGSRLKTYAGVVAFDGTLGTGPWTYMTYAEIMNYIASGYTGDALERVDFQRHLGGSNYGFCDGHAKWYRLDQTIPGGPGEDLSTPVKTTDQRLWGETNYTNSN